ncbi:hypothetical protein E2542_SST01327 [Spatholobus suberectus]|nr:hypothetical protein E2542_SST01327 [Spatholobus suberectus]
MEGGGGRVVGACDNEVGDDGMLQCTDHPHRTNPGGICAFCLQEKLGKLVSSSFPPPSSSSSSPSSSPPSSPPVTSSSVKTNHDHHARSRLPFLVPKKHNKKKPSTTTTNNNNSSSSPSGNIIFKRSKSTATPRRNPFLHENDFSPRKRNRFWSFLYPSSKPSASPAEPKSLGPTGDRCLGPSVSKKSDHVTVEEENACLTSSKVSRSRSVGCGSRSFSGDFFERISSGLGDCALRRVESQREGKPKVAAVNHCMRERVTCAGIFGAFVMTSSADDGRGRGWGWAFASPMRAFGGKVSSKRDASDKSHSPNLSPIPSLLAVRG